MDSLSLGAHKRWLRSLCKICDRQALLPRSLEIPLCYNPMDVPLCQGGFADMWKGQYHGRDIAAKALRVYQTNDFEQIRKVGCPQPALHTDELTVSPTEVLQGGRHMECPSTSQRATAARRDDVQ